ncbi:MAG TPA: heme exporter protein CcmD [Devosia sp.]|nr:heme exporter protein CcmD [Devosia sp.]
MIDLGPHITFILSSYIGTAIVVSLLIIWVWAGSNKQKKRLADLEAQGIVRRSQTES